MAIALPAEEWQGYAQMLPAELAVQLRQRAQQVLLWRYQEQLFSPQVGYL
jgi:hypothetical protein